MKRGLGLTVAIACVLLPTASAAIDAPPGAEDLRNGLAPLAQRFEAEKGEHRLLLLLSPA